MTSCFIPLLLQAAASTLPVISHRRAWFSASPASGDRHGRNHGQGGDVPKPGEGEAAAGEKPATAGGEAAPAGATGEAAATGDTAELLRQNAELVKELMEREVLVAQRDEKVRGQGRRGGA